MDQAYTNLGYGLKTFRSLNREKKKSERERLIETRPMMMKKKSNVSKKNHKFLP